MRVAVIMLALVLYGCDTVAGPEGPQGPQGEQGPAGPPGEDNVASVVEVEYQDSDLDLGLLIVPVPQITQEVMQSGYVLVHWQEKPYTGTSNEWTPLPHEIVEKDWTLTVRYTYRVGQVNFWMVLIENGEQVNPRRGGGKLKIIIFE